VIRGSVPPPAVRGTENQACRAKRAKVGVAKRQKKAGDVVVVFRWRGGAAGNPVEDVGIGAIEQDLVAVELSLVKFAQVLIGKAAENQVAFPRPAVPGTKQQSLATDLG